LYSVRQQTFVALKPDAVQRGLMGEIISRFEKKGFQLVACKFLTCSVEQAEKHYAEHNGKGFFKGLISFLTSGPVLAMVFQGKGVIASVRKMLGVTNPLNSEPGTIRGDFGVDTGRNLVHASSDEDAARGEIALWFKKEEIQEWKQSNSSWLYE